MPSVTAPQQFDSVGSMLQQLLPREPVYCIHRSRFKKAAEAFLNGFSGRVLYAVKANDEPLVLRALHAAGISHFDCASLPEVALVKENCPGAKCYFMIPVRLRGAASEAYHRYGVRHFLVDQLPGLEQLADEIDCSNCVIFARMAVHHEAATFDLSSKFGAAPDQVRAILEAIKATGAEAALAFNVGSSVSSPIAYTSAIETARQVLDTVPFPIRLVDMGGGFPHSYPDYLMPPVAGYFDAINLAASSLPLGEAPELMVEPGRALAAPGISCVVEILQRSDQRLYINDGMYGAFWELRMTDFKRFEVSVWRDGVPVAKCSRGEQFTLFGPTCDSGDVLPGSVTLPGDIKVGDYLEFSDIGAYSLAGRTRFNGHYSEQLVYIGE